MVKQIKKAISAILPLIIGGGFGYAIFHFGVNRVLDNYPKYYGLIFLLLIPLFYILVTGIHELGHIVAGLSQNFQFYGLTVGPFSWKPDKTGKVRFHWNRQLNISGGIAMMTPIGQQNLAKRFIVFAGGGPLASLLLTLLAFGIGSLLPSGTIARFMLGGIAFLSFAIFLVTIIPFRSAGFSSDGMRIKTLLQDSALAKAELLIIQLIPHIKAGLPYADLPIEDLKHYSSHAAIPRQQQLTLLYFLYLIELDAGQVEAAGNQLDAIMQEIEMYPKGLRESFYLEQAHFAAVHREDLAAAEAAMAHFKPTPAVEPLSIHLAQAAIARLKGDTNKMLSELTAAEQYLDTTMNQTDVPNIQKRIAQWRNSSAL